MSKADRLAAAILSAHLSPDGRVTGPDELKGKLSALIAAAYGPALEKLPDDAAPGTAIDWDAAWPVPPGWHVEFFPTAEGDASVGQRSQRHDRMNAGARLVKD